MQIEDQAVMQSELSPDFPGQSCDAIVILSIFNAQRIGQSIIFRAIISNDDFSTNKTAINLMISVITNLSARLGDFIKI